MDWRTLHRSATITADSAAAPTPQWAVARHRPARRVAGVHPRRVALATAAMVAGWCVSFVALPRAPWRVVGEVLVIAVAVAATVVAVLLSRSASRARAPLAFVAVGASTWALGMTARVLEFEGALGGDALRTSAQVAFLVAHLALVGAFLAVPVRRARARAHDVLDAVAIVGAVVAIAWGLSATLDTLMEPGAPFVIRDQRVPLLLEALTLGVVVHVVTRTTGRWRGTVLLGLVGVLAHLVADVALWAHDSLGGYEPGTITDLGWAIGWSAFIAAMISDWQPRASSRDVDETTLLPPVALLTAIVVLATVEASVGSVRDDPVLFGLAIGCFLIAIARSVTYQIDSTTLTRTLADRAHEDRERAERYEDALEIAGAGIWDWDIDTGEVRLSRSLGDLVDGPLSSRDDSVPAFLASLADDDRERLVAAFEEAFDEDDAVIRLDHRVAAADGADRYLELRGRGLRDPSGVVRAVTGVAIDVTDRRRDEARLAAHAARSAELAELGRRTLMADGVASVAQDAAEVLGRVLDAESCAIARIGTPGGRRETVASEHPATVNDEVSDGTVESGSTALSTPIVIEQGVWGVIEVRTRRRSGFTDADVSFAQAVAATLGHAVDLERAHDRLRHHALHDRLTGLPNRTLLVERATQLFREAWRNGRHVVAVHLGLDRFSLVNDSFGHAAGDRVLVEVGRRLESVCPPGGTVARADGDEFALVAEVDDPADAAGLADAVVRAVRAAITVGEDEVHLTPSVGVAVGGNTSDPDHLLLGAAVASHRAAERGGGSFEVFDDEFRDRVLRRVRLEADIRRGIRNGEFVPWYQPIVRVADGRIVGAEALARWQHPTDGVVLPGRFLPVAEQAGLMGELSARLLARSLDDVARWSDPGGEPLVLSLNLAASQLAGGNAATVLRRELERTGVEPDRICVEIVEGAIPDELTGVARDTMRELKQLGPVRISIDDFGTGHSSLSRLHALPVDAVKIDRSFVSAIEDDESDRSMVRAIVDMARALGLQVVAEGVETAGQLEVLRALGCPYAQGWYFAKAMPIEELLALPLQRDW